MVFRELVRHLCEYPDMYVPGPPTYPAVCGVLIGFDMARDGGPLQGFHEWLILRHKGGVNLHWTALAPLVWRRDGGDDGEEAGRIRALGRLIEEYLQYRDASGLEKIFFEYGRWLRRQRWYEGPLRD